MQKFEVAKVFQTPLRKFAVGDEITPADVAGAPISWADYVKGGFIKAVRAEKGEPGKAEAPKS